MATRPRDGNDDDDDDGGGSPKRPSVAALRASLNINVGALAGSSTPEWRKKLQEKQKPTQQGRLEHTNRPRPMSGRRPSSRPGSLRNLPPVLGREEGEPSTTTTTTMTTTPQLKRPRSKSPRPRGPSAGKPTAFRVQREQATLGRTELAAYELCCRRLEVARWIDDVLHTKLQEEDLTAGLQDGSILCRLMNTVAGDMIPTIHKMKFDYMKVENISFFIQACRDVGLPEAKLFEPVDLYDAKNMPKVIHCIHALAKHVEALFSFSLPISNVFGEVVFTEEEIEQAVTVLEEAEKAEKREGKKMITMKEQEQEQEPEEVPEEEPEEVPEKVPEEVPEKKQEQEQEQKQEQEQEQQQQQPSSDVLYQQALARAMEMDFTDLMELGILEVRSVDRFMRPIVWITPKYLPNDHVDLDRLFSFFIFMLDPIVRQDYIVVYTHTDANLARFPFSWLRKVYGLFARPYNKNLKNLLVVEPTIWLRGLFALMWPFMSPKFWRKLKYCFSLSDLFLYVDPTECDIPQAVIHTDPKLLRPRVSSLESVMKNGPPRLFVDSLRYLSERGQGVPSLFRAPHDTSDVERLHALYESLKPVDLSTVKKPCIVGALLKSFLFSLPEPICTFELFDNFLEANKEEHPVDAVRTLMSTLPAGHKRVAIDLLALLAAITHQPHVPEDATPRALSEEFAHVFLRRRGPGVCGTEPQDASAVVQVMVENYSRVTEALE